MIDLASPGSLALLAPVAVAVAAAAAATLRARLQARRVSREAADRAARARLLRVAAVAAAATCVVVALARPRWGAEVGPAAALPADVVIAVDVSASMLADDVKPSRIERARVVLTDLVDRLEGHRVGLVAFAGSSAILLPLTPDLRAARLFADHLQVHSVDEPGTSLVRAAERAVELFESGGQGERVLVVVSDGEDLESDPVEAANEAAAIAEAADVAVVTICTGTAEGSLIPLDVLGTRALKRGPDGEVVVTRARPDALAELGRAGLALVAERGDEAARIADLVASRAADAGPAGPEAREAERFQAPLALAFLLLFGEYLLASRRR